MGTLLCGTALAPVALAALFAGLPAFAACDLSGSTVTCTGTTAGFGDGTQSGLTINVQSGATVSADPAINIADTNTINNFGMIASPGDSGIGIALTNNNTISNSGTIRVGVDGDAIRGVGVTGNTVTNTGTIDGRITFVGAGNSVTNSGLLTIANPNSNTGLAHNSTTFTQTASGTLAPQVDNVGGMVGSVITQNATIAGTLRAIVRAGLYDPTTTYSSIVTAALSLNGTFDTVTTSSPFFSAAVNTTGNNINLTMTRIGFGAVPGMTSNQRAVGSALEPGYSTTLTGNAATFYGNLLAATSIGVYDQLSGQGTSAAQDAAFTAGSQFGNAMFQQGLAWLTGSGGATNSITLGYAQEPRSRMAGHEAFAAMRPRAAEPGRWRAWALGFGGTRTADGESSSGSADKTTHTYGGAFGVDRLLADDLLIGVAAGGTGSHFSVSSLSTSGDVDGGHVGVYAVKSFGASYLAATLNYARLDNKTERTITGVGPTETATGRFNSDQLGGRLEFGRRYRFDRYSVTPFLAIEPSVLWQQAYTESSTVNGGGNGILGLSYAAHTSTSLPLFLGAQADTRWTLSNGTTLSPSLRAAWVHEFMPERQIEATFVTVPSASFTVDGARAARDSVRVDAGATLTLNRSMALFANLNGELASGSRMASATGGATVTW